MTKTTVSMTLLLFMGACTGSSSNSPSTTNTNNATGSYTDTSTYTYSNTNTSTSTNTGTSTTTGNCLSLGPDSLSFSSIASSVATSADIVADMSSYSQLAGYVVVGVGADFKQTLVNGVYSAHAVGLYMKVQHLLPSGQVDATDSYNFGVGDLANPPNTTGSQGQIYMQLPPNYYVYGVGMGSQAGFNTSGVPTGVALEVIKVYGVSLNTDGSVLGYDQCVADAHSFNCVPSSNPADNPISVAYADRYWEYVGTAPNPLRALAVGISSTNAVRYLGTKFSSILSTTSNTGTCP